MTRSWRWTAAALCTALFAGACSSAARSNDEQSRAAARSPERALVRENITQVPGLEFASLSPWGEDDEAAHMSAQNVLERVRAALPPAPEGTRADDPRVHEDADETGVEDVPREALMRYLRGREARQDGRFAEAARDLDAARRLDPDAPRVLLELGRAMGGLGDTATAMELFRRVLEINPVDPFAALMVLGDDVQQGRYTEALHRYAQLTRDIDRFEHDAAAALVSVDMLRAALLGLGHDRVAAQVTAELLADLDAFNDVTGYQVAFGQLMEQRGRIAIEAVDASLRLRDSVAAEWFAERAAGYGDTDRHGLGSRLVALRLLRGDAEGLLRDVADQWTRPGVMLLDRDVRLAAFLREQSSDPAALLGALLRGARGARQPIGADAVVMWLRLLAAATPNDAEAQRGLEEAQRLAPRDEGVLRDRLDRARSEGGGSARQLAEQLLQERPEMARMITVAYAAGVRFPPPLDAAPGSPRSEELDVRLHARFSDPGGAWRRLMAARAAHPGDAGLRRLQIELAGELDEPQLLAPLLDGVFVEPEAQETAAQLWTRLVIAEALLRHGRGAEGGEFARRVRFALERGAQTGDAASPASAGTAVPDRWMLARARFIEARAFAEQAALMDINARRTATFEHASRLAYESHREDPRLRDAATFLLNLHRPSGPVPDAQRVSALMQELSRDPESLSAVAVIVAGDYLQRGMARSSMQYAELALAANKLDDEAVSALVLAMEQLGRSADAERALLERIERRPGDIASIDLYLGMLMRRDDHRGARRFLQSRLQERPDDRIALGRLEVIARATDRDDEAMRLGIARLRLLPEGTRQRLQLASLLVQSGEFTQSLEVIERIAADEAATARHLTLAMSLLGQVPRPEPRADRLTVRIAEQLIGDPQFIGRADIPSAALASLARLRQHDEMFARMVSAVLVSPMGRDGGTSGVMQMRELAQRLIFAGSAEAAARLLEARLLSSNPLTPEAAVVVASMQLLSDAASDPTGQRVLALLDRLQLDGLLAALPGLDGVDELAEAAFIASQIAMMVGNEDGAAALLERVIELDPSISMAKNNLAYMQLEAGASDDRTVRLVRTAGELHPDDPSVRDTVAWMEYHLGAFEEAEREFSELAALPDAPSDVFNHWGDALYRLGREEEAVAAWRSALARKDAERGSRLEALERFRALQVRGWGLLVVDPEVLYHQQVSEPRARLTAKIESAQAGTEPMIAPTFTELGLRISDVHARQPVPGGNGQP